MLVANRASTHDHAALHGRVVLITGGSRGLGAAIASVLGAAGMRLILVDIAVQRVQDFAAVLAEWDIEAIALPLDVSDSAQCFEAIDRVTQRFGRLDALISNAAVDNSAPPQGLSAASWQRIVAAHLSSPFLLSNHAVRLMVQQADAHIVNITSRAGPCAPASSMVDHTPLCRQRPPQPLLHAELRPQTVKVTDVPVGCMRSFDVRGPLEFGDRPGQDPMRLARQVRSILKSAVPASTGTQRVTSSRVAKHTVSRGTRDAH